MAILAKLAISLLNVAILATLATLSNLVILATLATFLLFKCILHNIISQAKTLVVSGSPQSNMELVDLSTQQSCLLPFPLKNAIGGRISETEAHFCDFELSGKCALLNLSTLKSEYSKATVELQKRSRSFILNGQIVATGGRINGQTSPSDQVQLVTLTESIIGPPFGPGNLDSHCILHINETTLAVISGYISGNTLKSWFLHLNAGNSWTTVSGTI